MNNLVDSGLNLKSIEVRNLHQIVSDLNYNFTQILHLPGFKGQTGQTGASTTGATGQRGNVWIFANSQTFITNYTTITSSGQVTLSFLNSQLIANLPLLLTSLNTTSIIQNDIVVLPSRDVIQFNSVTNTFIETGIRFADGLSLTESQVVTIVNNILGGLSNNDVYTTYKGVVKNYADSGLGLNTDINSNSILDVSVSGAGSGVISSDFMFTALKEVVVNGTVQNMLLTGSPQKYHELVQSTQTSLTNDYMCGVDDFGALAVMQNSYNNGIILGHKDSNNFATWGRIYRTQNVLRLLSDYHPNIETVSRLDLSKTTTELYSPKDLKIINKDGFISITDYVTNKHYFYANSSGVSLGNVSTPSLSLNTNSFIKVNSSIGLNTDILSLQNGLLKASLYQPKSDVLVNDYTKIVTHNLLHLFKVDVDNIINNLDIRVTTLENQKVYKQQTYITTSTSLNTLVQFGLYIIKTSTSVTYTNVPNLDFNSVVGNVGYLKVNRFSNGSEIRLEQEFVENGFGDGTVKATRRAFSNDNGATFVFTQWTYTLDSDNFSFKSGAKILMSSEKFNDSFNITVNHATHTTTSIEANNPSTDSHKVSKGVKMDSTGHPTSVIEQDLDEWYYDKPEINTFLDERMPIGGIIMWSGQANTIPNKWKLCDGNNGTPNLSGRFIVSYDASNSQYDTVGNVGGTDEVTLTTNEMPPHKHTGITDWAGNHTHTGHVGEASGDWRGGGGNSAPNSTSVPSTVSQAGTHLHELNINNEGGGQAHENRPSFYVMAFIQFKG